MYCKDIIEALKRFLNMFEINRSPLIKRVVPVIGSPQIVIETTGRQAYFYDYNEERFVRVIDID